MNVFELRDRLVADYRDFTRSFLDIADRRIRGLVDDEFDRGLLWPEPLIQLNPAFQSAGTIDDLIAEGSLHEECGPIFRRDKDTVPGGTAFRLHRHQVEAIRTARLGSNYVLTTGTGSGKSLAYIIPIVDSVLRSGRGDGRIKAIVVYPMNALANSQLGELSKFLSIGFPDGKGPVTFARYTGQEKDEERQRIIGNPPDILLTNYVMLELLLTRPYGEEKLVEAARDLRFLILDELHTYRGRQGADVALLVRRVREATHATALQCVGTSATLATKGSFTEQQARIADVASTIFGDDVSPDSIIGESLRRATVAVDASNGGVLAELRRRVTDPSWSPPATDAGFVADPLAGWVESTFGLTTEEGSERLVRARPIAIAGPDGAAQKLADATDTEPDACAAAIRRILGAGFNRRLPDSGFPVFAFRLHQFFGRGDTVYASIEPEETRHLTTQGQLYVPGERDKLLVPLAFCRECGQDYYLVARDTGDPTGGRFVPRDLGDLPNEDDRDQGRNKGFLFLGSDVPWPDEVEDQIGRVPEDWLEERPDGSLRVKKSFAGRLPFNLDVAPDGRGGVSGVRLTYVPAPFRFCLRCGVTYGGRQSRDHGKLTTLGSGGRSSATSLLSLSAIRGLREDTDLPPHARKLLSFCRRRADARGLAAPLSAPITTTIRTVRSVPSPPTRH